MAKKKGKPSIGYRPRPDITLTSHPPFLAPENVNPNANAVWVLTDLLTLAEAVQPYVASTGDGDKYSARAIRDAVALLNKRIIAGGPKKKDGTKDRLVLCFKNYKAITYLKSRSGAAFDDINGANVITPEEDRVWQGVVASYEDCEPFRNQGWLPYAAFAALDPTKPKGDSSFRPRIGVQGVVPIIPPGTEDLQSQDGGSQPQEDTPHLQQRPPSPTWDIEHDLPLPDDNEHLAGEQSQTPAAPAAPTAPTAPAAPATVPVTPAPGSAKRPAPAPLSATSRKKARASAENVLALAVDGFGDKLMGSTAQLTSVLREANSNASPSRRKTALDRAHREEWLDADDRRRLVKILRNKDAREEYLSYEDRPEAERKAWVCDELGYPLDFWKDLGVLNNI